MSKHCDHNFAINLHSYRAFYPHRHFCLPCLQAVSEAVIMMSFFYFYPSSQNIFPSAPCWHFSFCHEHLIFFPLLFHYPNPLFLCPTISLCLVNGLLSSNLSIHTLLEMVGSAESSRITGLLLRKHISGCKKMLSISTLRNNKSYMYAYIEIYWHNRTWWRCCTSASSVLI